MNKVLRVLLFAVVVLAMVVPMTIAAQPPAQPPDWNWRDNAMMTIPGKIFNGTNGGPASPVIVRLWRDTGGGDVMVQEKTFSGPTAGKTWSNQFSAMGDFLFQVSCVPGYYTIQIESFMEGGADAVGVVWWQGATGTGRILKKEAGDPGPWTFSWYQACYQKGNVQLEQIIFEYSSVAGPRANAGWMYLSGRVFDTGIPAAMKYYKCGDNMYRWADVDPLQAVPGAAIRVARIAYDQKTNTADPTTWINIPGTLIGETFRDAVTSPNGYWGMGLSREPGFYMVYAQALPAAGQWASARSLFFQVFDVYASGGWDEAYGPGSSWLPWNFMQPDWIYGNLNFAAMGTKVITPLTNMCP